MIVRVPRVCPACPGDNRVRDLEIVRICGEACGAILGAAETAYDEQGHAKGAVKALGCFSNA